jgi:hypothetical protein
MDQNAACSVCLLFAPRVFGLKKINISIEKNVYSPFVIDNDTFSLRMSASFYLFDCATYKFR